VAGLAVTLVRIVVFQIMATTALAQQGWDFVIVQLAVDIATQTVSIVLAYRQYG